MRATTMQIYRGMRGVRDFINVPAPVNRTHDARASEYLYLTRAKYTDRAESRYYNNSNSKFELGVMQKQLPGYRGAS